LRNWFTLPDLEQLVTVTPRFDGAIPKRSESLRRRLLTCAPYLAASALDAAPARADRLLPRLRTIEVVCCRALTLDYELDGRRKSRPEATVHLTQRHDQRRVIGTIYLELNTDEAEPDWYALGPVLAQFVGVPSQGDAYSLLLGATHAHRRAFLAARQISLDEVERWAAELQTRPEELEGLEDLLEADLAAIPDAPSTATRQAPLVTAVAAAPAGGAQPGTTLPVPEPPELPPLEHDELVIETGRELAVSAPTRAAAFGAALAALAMQLIHKMIAGSVSHS